MPTIAYAASTLCLLAIGLSAQPPIPTPGFSIEVAHRATGALASLSSVVVSRDGGTLYFAHQHQLYSADLAGNRRIVAWFDPGEWIGELCVDPRDDRVWLTNYATDGLFAFEPRTGTLRAVGTAPHNTFALAIDPASGTLLASANPLWPGPGASAGIFAIDLVQARHREIIRCDGPSGPLAFGPGGDLVYATQANTFPPPPGQTELRRASRAQLAQVLAGGPRLQRSDLQLVAGGLDGAYDLAIDARNHAYVTDAHRGQVQRVSLATGTIDPTPALATGALATTDLASVAGTGAAAFAPFQPAMGGTLLVTLPDWNAIRTDVLALRPARPTLTALPGLPLPRGPARIELTGAIPSAPCALLLTPLPPLPEYVALHLDGLPVWAALDPGFPWLAWPAVSDATGVAVFAFRHDVPGALPLSAQAISLADATRHGTSTCLVLTFLP